MDILYYKVFKNKYLYYLIFDRVKIGKGKQLKDIKIEEILENRFLFNLYYQSYIFNKENENEINFKFQFKDLNIIKSFLLSNIITIEEFISIYNDHEKILKKKKNKILKLAIQNNNIGKDIIEFLIHYKNYKFDINHFQSYIGNMCKINHINSKFIVYVIDCFKNHSYNYNYTNNDNNKNNNKNNKNKINNNKNNNNKLVSNPLSLKFETLIDCLENGKEFCYKTIMDLSFNSMVDENGKDLPFKSNCEITTTRNQLITRMVGLGSIKMAKVYINKFPNQPNEGGKDIFFKDIKSFSKSLQVYEALLLNKTLTISNTHYLFSPYSFLTSQSVNCFKNFLENHIGFDTSNYQVHYNFSIYDIKDLETLKYLEQVKDKFKPKPLEFQPDSLLLKASIKRDFQLFKYLAESPFFKAVPTDSINFSNTSLEIVKYCFEKFSQYIFSDVGFGCAFDGDLEYAKFIVDKYHSVHSKRVQLSYRCIDRVCEKGYTHLLIYLLHNLPGIQISREPINEAIKKENFEMVQLLINIIPTKPNDKPTLYDSTLIKLKSFSEKDNRILSLLIDNQIYGNILIKKNYFE
ncbi:hypothetical protein ACTFIU_004856 [Dictyostelium citrinum]